MSLNPPNIQEIDGSGLRLAIIASRYNQSLVDSLLVHTIEALNFYRAPTPVIERVPGAAELPFAVASLAAQKSFDAIIAIGVVIAGETMHHEIIGNSTAQSLVEVSLSHSIPVINGILVVDNQEQATARVGKEINRGLEFAQAALEMAQFSKKWMRSPKT